MKNIAIIMAGGNGTRFWPLSRKDNPKQFQSIATEDTLLNETIKRINKVIPINQIYIVGSLSHKTLLEKTLPDNFIKKNILLEPIAKNTAAAIACSVQYINNQNGDVNLGIFPADHFIKDVDKFAEIIRNAYKESELSSKIVTLGINTSFPSTGFGYLQSGIKLKEEVFKLNNFTEKPNHTLAMKYHLNSNYYWNSGIIFCKSSVILNKIFQYLPDLYLYSSQVCYWDQELKSGTLLNLYSNLESISIDYGVLEKCSNLLMIPMNVGWSDLGSWDALPDIMETDKHGNINDNNHILLDTKNSIIISKSKVIATIGLDNIIIVEVNDTLLVCKKDQVQNIKELVLSLTEHGNSNLT